MITKRSIWMLGVAMSLIAQVVSAANYATPEGVTLMSEEDIKSKIVGSTLEGVMKTGEHWAEWYGETGKVVGRWKKSSIYYGKWRTDGRVFCVKFPNDPGSNWCNTMSLQGNEILFHDKKGKVEGNGATLRQGKPDWL